MKRTAIFAFFGAAVLGGTGIAWADSGVTPCGSYGKYSALREVSGQVISTGTDRLGYRHLVVQDQHSGCRVFVLNEDQSCKTGTSFGGFGRLRTAFKGEGYDATLQSKRSVSKCQADGAGLAAQ